FAVADAPGTALLYVPEYHVAASLADWTQNRVGRVQTIPCERISLDALIAKGAVPQPDFVKCDVEGAELLVFRGAVRMLDRPDAPIVMYEANLPGAHAFGFSIAASTEFLAQLPAPGYSFFWIQPQGTLRPVPDLQPGCELLNPDHFLPGKRELWGTQGHLPHLQRHEQRGGRQQQRDVG